MELAIVTGASKGLGDAVVKGFLQKGVKVIGVARGDVNQESLNYQHIQADLSNIEMVLDVVNTLLREIEKQQLETVYVIHNAGMIEPIGRVGYLNVQQMTAAVNLNLLAPMLITNELMHALHEKQVRLVVVNVSSGAAERAIYGWSVYNSTKAALNMHTQIAGLEQEYDEGRHTVIAFSPGVMDTTMQETIRNSDEAAFKDVVQFRQYKENGSLRSPKLVGDALVKLVYQNDLENGRVYSVRDLL